MNPVSTPTPDVDVVDAPADLEVNPVLGTDADVPADATPAEPSDEQGDDDSAIDWKARYEALQKRKEAGDKGAINAANKAAKEAQERAAAAEERIQRLEAAQARQEQQAQQARLNQGIEADLQAERTRLEEDGYDPATIDRHLTRMRTVLEREAETAVIAEQAALATFTQWRRDGLTTLLADAKADAADEGLEIQPNFEEAYKRLKLHPMAGPGNNGQLAANELHRVVREYTKELRKAALAAKTAAAATEGRKRNAEARTGNPEANPDQMGDGGTTGLDYRLLVERRAKGLEPDYAKYREKMLKSAPDDFLRSHGFI